MFGPMMLASLAACSRGAEAPPPVAAAPPTTKSLPDPLVSRGELLRAVAAAAEATATGSGYPKAALDLAGRRFALKLPFGCAGPRSDASVGYVYDEARQTLKLTARPEQWGEQDWARSLVGSDQTEAIEGFWVRRPWLASETCPMDQPAMLLSPFPETVGLAQVFDKGGSRLLQRGARPYEVTRKVEDISLLEKGGFRIGLEGRLVGDATGRPIACLATGPDSPPLCLVRVALDRVSLESADGQALGEWTS